MHEKILIVDDEESIRYTFHEFLHGAGYHVSTADSLPACIEKMQTEAFDLLVLDVNLGNDNGITAIEQLTTLQPECKVVIITGNPRLQSLVEARRLGAVDYLSKPVREASLLYNVRKVLAH